MLVTGRDFQPSMGPRSVDRGISRTKRRSHKHILLQWGRDLLIAEFRHGETRMPPIGTPSMGPRSVDRGIGSHQGALTMPIFLQWGRDLLIAELFARRTIAGSLDRLQWGRALLIAEFSEVARARRDTTSFNGAAIC